MADELRRAKLKASHALRSQFNFQVGLDRIDHRFDVIYPALDKIDQDAVAGKLPEFILEEDNENPSS